MGIMSGRDCSEFEEFKDVEVDEELHGSTEVSDTHWAKELADALLEKAGEADIDKFPDYLVTCLKNDFPEDDYILMSVLIEGTDPALRTLRHNYADYYEWYEAMGIYEDQMDHLVSIYRSEEWVKVGLKEKFIPSNLLPRKPKLKNSKKNRQLIRFGAPPQKPCPPEFTPEEIKKLVDAYVPAPPIDQVDEQDFIVDINDLPKAEKKIIKKAYERVVMGYRKAGIYRREGCHDSTIDAISLFMSSRTAYKYTANGEYHDDRALIDIVRDGEKWDFYQEEIIEDRIGAKVITTVNGRVVDATEADAVDVFQYMLEQGYGSTIIKGSGLSKSAVRMLKRELGSNTTGPLTKKERRRLKKNQKKAIAREKQIAKERYEADRQLSSFLGSGETMFRGPDGQIINLGSTLRNWFGDDD